jgi:predicted short-subunit dehydrogenase-like oxidoreductase (DUF2520 family)
MTDSEPRTAIVGTGRVAQAFGRLLAEAGHPPVAVGGRTPAHAERAASFIGPTVKVLRIRDVPAVADRVVIAVSDQAIGAAADELALSTFSLDVALHTSGAHGPELLSVLAERGAACGVLHPLQTIADRSLGVKALRGASYGIGGDAAAVEWAEQVVAIAGGTALRIAPTGFASYHAGAVMASNAVVAAVDAAVVLLGAAGVDRIAALRAIRPLCLTSAGNALDLGPEAALTGPVQRGDAETIRIHRAALDAAPRYVADLYRAASRALLDIARRKGLSDGSATAIETALDS